MRMDGRGASNFGSIENVWSGALILELAVCSLFTECRPDSTWLLRWWCVWSCTTVLMTKMIGTGGAWLMLSGLAVTIFIFVAGMELKDIVELAWSIEERVRFGSTLVGWGQDVLNLLKESSRDIADSVTGTLRSIL